MSGRIILLGATGYTGDLVLDSLLRRGVRPTVAGRNPAAVEGVAQRAGGLDHLVVDAADSDGLKKHLRRGDVLITTVGPFARFGFPVAQAAADAGAHYIDSTGEVGFVQALHDRHHRRARETGAVMLPAFGYDYVPGVLAGALALQEAGAAARALDVGYFSTGPIWRGISQGTRTTMRDGMILPSARWHRHRLVDERTASRVHRFTVRGRRKSAFLVSGTEVLFLPQEFPALDDVTVYNGWFSGLSRPVSFYSAFANAVTRLPAGRKLADALTRPLLLGPPGGPDAALRARIPSYAVAVASTGVPGSAPLAEVHLEGPNPYSLTGELIAWAADHIAAGFDVTPGVVGPTAAFGLDTLRQGCAEVGLVTV
ncbi:saccharopine dehydrogenase NADP-binding domain-containing protein [Streptomyces sp. NA04227]|uniref:saccharopine dehydrogenase family protein n=1 Tax=Streptomyces sp. NA04227 TaxID=2742136 RepID=UPI00158FA90F|nr:saccharopine dehydrogenase NADP-binding domain-containing protein [Streptomyces sp. NA04227]QKW09864.1 saccharopine dehydrogenase NADP-binding domain-containing protein [Streptomyces sp. NA04227]